MVRDLIMFVLTFGGPSVNLLPEVYHISRNNAVNVACPWLEVEQNSLCKEKDCKNLPFPLLKKTNYVNYWRTGYINYIVGTVLAEIMYECPAEETEERIGCAQGVMKSYHEKFCFRPNPCWRKEGGCHFSLDFSYKIRRHSTDDTVNAVNEACPWLETERNFLCKGDKDCKSLPFPSFRGIDRVNYKRTGRINYIVGTVMAEIIYGCPAKETKEERIDCAQGVMKSYHEKFCLGPALSLEI